MKPTTTILLFLAAAALGAYVFFIERDQPGTRVLTTEPPLRFSAAAANLITITRSGETLALKRSGDNRWYLSQPVNDRADQQACADFLETLSALSIREVIHSSEIESGSVQLADLGLAPEKGIALAVIGTNGPLASVVIGGRGALDNTTYATFPDDAHYPHVYVVDADLNAFGSRTITALRDPNVLPFTPGCVGRLLLHNGDGEVEVSYDPRLGLWKLGKPLQSRADQKAVEDLIDKICALKVVGFEENSEKIAPTITGRQSISIWTIDPETGAVPASDSEPSIVLDIAPIPLPTPSGERPANAASAAQAQAIAEKIPVLGKVSDREAVLRVPDEVVNLLASSPASLRDHHLAQIPEKEIRGIIVQSADNPDVILTNNGRRWVSLRNGAWEPADEVAITRLLRALNKEDVIDFVDDTSANLADFDLAPPAIRIGLTTSRKVMAPGVQQPPPAPPIAAGAGAPPGDSSDIEDPDALDYVLGLGRIPASKENDFDRLYASFAGEPFVVSIDPAFLENVPTHPLSWKDPVVFGFNIISLREIRIARSGDPAEMRLAYDPFAGAWKYSRGESDLTATLDPKKAHALAETLGSLAARDWLINREPAYRALEHPAVTIGIILSFLSEDGNEDVEKRTVLTFAPIAASDPADPSHFHYARIDDSPEVFLVDNKTLQSLLAPVTR